MTVFICGTDLVIAYFHIHHWDLWVSPISHLHLAFSCETLLFCLTFISRCVFIATFKKFIIFKCYFVYFVYTCIVTHDWSYSVLFCNVQHSCRLSVGVGIFCIQTFSLSTTIQIPSKSVTQLLQDIQIQAKKK